MGFIGRFMGGFMLIHREIHGDFMKNLWGFMGISQGFMGISWGFHGDFM